MRSQQLTSIATIVLLSITVNLEVKAQGIMGLTVETETRRDGFDIYSVLVRLVILHTRAPSSQETIPAAPKLDIQVWQAYPLVSTMAERN